jgi:hypothetical protein
LNIRIRLPLLAVSFLVDEHPGMPKPAPAWPIDHDAVAMIRRKPDVVKQAPVYAVV